MSHVSFLGGGGGGRGVRAKMGASSRWMVFHPLGTALLVLIQTTIVVYCNSIDSVENLSRGVLLLERLRRGAESGLQ